MANPENDREAVLSLIDRIARPGERLMIGIAGPPGSGKSTLSAQVVDGLNAREEPSCSAALLPMDGFHLDNEIIRPMGLLSRRGAPETFDYHGLCRLLEQVRANRGDLRYPLFDREADRSLIDVGLLESDTRIVVVEGNYLLLDQPVWSDLKALFDATVFIDVPLETLEERLMARWLNLGFEPEQARLKVQGNDLKNARLVLEQSVPADLML